MNIPGVIWTPDWTHSLYYVCSSHNGLHQVCYPLVKKESIFLVTKTENISKQKIPNVHSIVSKVDQSILCLCKFKIYLKIKIKKKVIK